MLARQIITVIGSIDAVLCALTLARLTNFLRFEYPEAQVHQIVSEAFFPYPTFELSWFLTNCITCLLHWLASANMALASTFSRMGNFKSEAFLPWFVFGIFFLFLSLVGNALVGDMMTTAAVVTMRTIFLGIIWISYEKWDSEEASVEEKWVVVEVVRVNEQQ